MHANLVGQLVELVILITVFQGGDEAPDPVRLNGSELRPRAQQVPRPRLVSRARAKWPAGRAAADHGHILAQARLPALGLLHGPSTGPGQAELVPSLPCPQQTEVAVGTILGPPAPGHGRYV